MICKKCNGVSSIILRKKDCYCESCFTANVSHKFRACLGKSKLISPRQNVLICLSGGEGSTVLLDIVYNALCLDNHKKLRITPLFLHICSDKNTAEAVIQQCRKYHFDVYIANICDYFTTSSHLPDVNCIPDMSDQHNEFLKKMPPTVHCDFLNKLKRSLYIRFAEVLQCEFVFTAETTTSLAISLLANLAIGRGAQVESDIGFLDSRSEKIKILRPMKDISKEELNYYISIKKLSPVNQNNMQENSLHSAINGFVTDLQDNFPATISTVCKTADKIGEHEHDDSNPQCSKCIICESVINQKEFKLSALEATSFSRMVSNTKPQYEEYVKDQLTVAQSPPSLFPFINESLCYSCSRNYSEMSQCELPQHIQNVLRN